MQAVFCQRIGRTLVGVFVAMATASGSAHHAFSAEFDANKPISLKGKIVKMEWINPHSWLHIEVVGPNGKKTDWMIEGGPPGVLVRRGWTKDSIKVGLDVVVEGYQAKNGSNRINAKDLLLPDGRRLFAGSSGTGAPYDQK